MCTSRPSTGAVRSLKEGGRPWQNYFWGGRARKKTEDQRGIVGYGTMSAWPRVSAYQVITGRK